MLNLPPPCEYLCGGTSNATTQVSTGKVKRGGRWVTTYVWACDECAQEAQYERDWSVRQ